MKREEFWLGVCVYLLIILAGHLGPNFSKIPFLNQTFSELLRFHGQATEEKLASPMAFKANLGNSLAMKDLENLKRSGGYLPVQSSKFNSRLTTKGNGSLSSSPRQAHGPISPISFSL